MRGGGGGGGDAAASAPTVAPFISPASPDICETPPEISPLLMQRLQVVEPRSYLLLSFLFF